MCLLGWCFFPSVLGTIGLWDGRGLAPLPRRLTSQSCPPVRTGRGAIPRGRRHRGRGRVLEGHHGQGESVLGFSGILVVLSQGCSGHRPLCRPMEATRISPRDRRRLYGDPDRAAPPVGAGPGWCQSRLGASSLSQLVLHVFPRPAPPRFPNKPMPNNFVGAMALIVASVALHHRRTALSASLPSTRWLAPR